jgi:hypothetical protein
MSSVSVDQEKVQAQFDVILHLIGQIVVAWGLLDESLIRLLARLLGCRPKAAGIAYYALDATSTRLAVIRGLAEHKLKPNKKRMNLLAFLTRLEKLGTARNDIIHAVYGIVYDPKISKWKIEKMIFRSARKELYQLTIAQTGELETHLRLLRGARLWLWASSWLQSGAESLPPDLLAKIMALNTATAASAKKT